LLYKVNNRFVFLWMEENMGVNKFLDAFILMLVIFVLLGFEWWGYRRWIKPHASHLTLSGKLMLFLIILTMVGGFLGPFVWWINQPGTFAWSLPPLAARMLASAGWCFAFAGFLALQYPSQRRLRLILLMLVIYMAPLVVALLLFHRDRLDFAAPITYPFLAVASILTLGSLWFFFRQPEVLPNGPKDLQPSSAVTRVWLGLIAFVTAVWGVALFLTDKGPLTAIWVWPGDLLSSRLISVMLLTIAISAMYSLRYADTSKIMTGITMIYGLGLAIASLWNMFAGKPIKMAYLVVFSLIFFGSLIVMLLDRADYRKQSVIAPVNS
jgi:hypothetical protein